MQDLSDPQQWNGYSYAGNNPTTYSDPTGHIGTPDMLPNYDGDGSDSGGGGIACPQCDGSSGDGGSSPSPSPDPPKGGTPQPTAGATPSPSPSSTPIPISCVPADMCRDAYSEFILSFLPFSDAPACYEGDKVACGFVVADGVPGGKIAGGSAKAAGALITAVRLGKYLDEIKKGRGVWDLPAKGHGNRGYQVESKIMDELGLPGLPASNNPGIDSWIPGAGKAISVKSKDLDYALVAPGSLKRELRRDIRKLDKWNGETYGDCVSMLRTSRRKI